MLLFFQWCRGYLVNMASHSYSWRWWWRETRREKCYCVFSLFILFIFFLCLSLFFSLFFLLLSPFSLFTCFSSLCFVFKKNPLKLFSFSPPFLYYLILFYPYSICLFFIPYSPLSYHILKPSTTFHIFLALFFLI
jgi:hypothetical protein